MWKITLLDLLCPTSYYFTIFCSAYAPNVNFLCIALFKVLQWRAQVHKKREERTKEKHLNTQTASTCHKAWQWNHCLIKLRGRMYSMYVHYNYIQLCMFFRMTQDSRGDTCCEPITNCKLVKTWFSPLRNEDLWRIYCVCPERSCII